MDAICIKDLKKDLKREMDDSRYEHTLGVMYTSAALAMRYEYDMERAMHAGFEGMTVRNVYQMQRN